MKILLKVDNRSSKKELYRFYQEENNEGVMVDWETGDESELAEKILEIVETTPNSLIMPVDELRYLLDVIFDK